MTKINFMAKPIVFGNIIMGDNLNTLVQLIPEMTIEGIKRAMKSHGKVPYCGYQIREGFDNTNWSDPDIETAIRNTLIESININGENDLEQKNIKPPMKRIASALELAIQYGGIDGSHHKDWVIDQMVRVLAGEQYDFLVADAKNGEDGPDTYEWNIGIAP